jgi:hypothetical protein
MVADSCSHRRHSPGWDRDLGLQPRKVDEVEVCLLHTLEPDRSLVFDWLADPGFTHREDGHWLAWRSRRIEGD